MQKNILILVALLFFLAIGAFILFPKDEGSRVGLENVFLYYYNPENDIDENGNIKCGADGLVPVRRSILSTENLISETINLLISGDLKPEEIDDGVTTEFPLDGFSFKNYYLQDGALILEFIDSQNQTVGGACRVGILWAQIEKTAKQFPGVDEVRFIPEEIFQP